MFCSDTDDTDNCGASEDGRRKETESTDVLAIIMKQGPRGPQRASGRSAITAGTGGRSAITAGTGGSSAITAGTGGSSFAKFVSNDGCKLFCKMSQSYNFQTVKLAENCHLSSSS